MDTAYKAAHPFTGTVKKALVDVTGEAVEDMAAKMKVYLSWQRAPPPGATTAETKEAGASAPAFPFEPMAVKARFQSRLLA
jgi:hypothetical protein